MRAEQRSGQLVSVRVQRGILLMIATGAAAWGVLQLDGTAFAAEHSICGPWGCGPPASALLACHGFWLVVLGGPTIAACAWLDPSKVRLGGQLAMTVGVLAALGVGVWEGLYWLPGQSAFSNGYFVQRWLFSIAVLVDFPIAQLCILGAVCFIHARARIPSLPETEGAVTSGQ